MKLLGGHRNTLTEVSQLGKDVQDEPVGCARLWSYTLTTVYELEADDTTTNTNCNAMQ